jgi:hypothetical protein
MPPRSKAELKVIDRRLMRKEEDANHEWTLIDMK